MNCQNYKMQISISFWSVNECLNTYITHINTISVIGLYWY